MPPKKGITFGKIGSSMNHLSIHTKDNAKDAEGFGKFGTKISDAEDVVAESTQEMEKAMGIKGFGKVAKSFNLEEMVAQSKQAAKERAFASQVNKIQESASEESDEDFVGPPLPTQSEPKEINTFPAASENSAGKEKKKVTRLK